MTTTTALLINSVLIVGLLSVLALVMRFGHGAAGFAARPESALGRLELECVAETGPDLERAA